MNQKEEVKPVEGEFQGDNTYFSNIVEWVKSIYRFIEICVIFTPVFLTMPLALTRYKKVFLKCLVKAIEDAGVVFIKVFQYLSHRRDIIG